MKIVSFDIAQSSKYQSAWYKNKYNTNISKSPNFGNSKTELAKTVLENKSLMELFGEFISKVGKTSPTEAFLELIAIAAGSIGLEVLSKNLKNDGTNSATHKDTFENFHFNDTYIFPDYTPLVKSLNNTIKFDSINTNPKTFDTLAESESKQEATPTDELNTGILSETNKPAENFNDTQKAEEAPKQFVFPAKAKLSTGQQSLKTASEQLVLDKDAYEKLDKICRILLADTHCMTSTGIKLNCNTVAEALASQLAENVDTKKQINNTYDMLHITGEIKTYTDDIEALTKENAQTEAPDKENLKNTTDEVPETSAKQYSFPKKWGRLSSAQETLKKTVEQLSLEKEAYEQLDEICRILVANKEYTTENGILINCNEFANTLAINLNPKNPNIVNAISIAYDIFGLNDKKTESENPTQQVDCKAEQPDSTTKNTNPQKEAETDDERGKNIIPSQTAPEKSFVQKVPHSPKKIKLADEYKNTPENPIIQYRYIAPKRLKGNDIFETSDYRDSIGPDGKKIQYLKNTEGALSHLINEFRLYSRHPENVANMETYFNNKLMQFPSLPLHLRFFTGTPISRKKQYNLNNLKKELYSTEYLKDDSKTSTTKCTENHYKKIAKAIKKYGEEEFLTKMFNMINAPENKKYLQYFTLHAAARFIERYVDLDDIDNIETQFTQRLDMLHNILNRALLNSGIEVKMYLPFYSAKISNGKISVSYSASLIIPSEIFTEEEKNVFGTDVIMLGTGVNIVHPEEDMTVHQPIIKSIYTEPVELIEKFST